MLVPDVLTSPQKVIDDVDLVPLLFEIQKSIRPWGRKGKIEIVVTLKTEDNLDAENGIKFEKRVEIPFNRSY